MCQDSSREVEEGDMRKKQENECTILRYYMDLTFFFFSFLLTVNKLHSFSLITAMDTLKQQQRNKKIEGKTSANHCSLNFQYSYLFFTIYFNVFLILNLLNGNVASKAL